MIRFRFDPAEGLANRLEKAAARGRFAIAAVEAVNAVAERADRSLRAGETRDINLTPAYVKSKTDVTLARPGGKPRAEIKTKGDLTILGRFAPLSRVVAPGAPRKAGPIKGFRSAGTRVAIRRSTYLTENQWFIMRLKNGNGFGVFVRDPRLAPGRGKREGRFGKRHIYGPSPYQLFKHQIGQQSDDITDDLRADALRRMGLALEEDLA